MDDSQARKLIDSFKGSLKDDILRYPELEEFLREYGWIYLDRKLKEFSEEQINEFLQLLPDLFKRGFRREQIIFYVLVHGLDFNYLKSLMPNNIVTSCAKVLIINDL